MSYLALARKWRPRTFSELIGQEHIRKALSNALDQKRLHHAYLFTGTRGVGKTSIARIVAKALNCEQGVSSKPCLSCDTCLAISQGRFIDLIEIDGASKTRVEDIRELLDNVQYATTNARFKIYLIDEVHMLSQHSFNALLKTLEEPPAHVKFILATTDPQKLPITVLSRCLQFHLKPLTSQLIAHQLAFILKEEGLHFEEKALQILAEAAKGSLRDGLSLLDNAINCAGTSLQTEDVKLLLGFTKEDYALFLLNALAAENPSELLRLTQQIEAQGGQFDYVLDELINHLHQMAVYLCLREEANSSASSSENPLISLSSEVKTLALQFSAENIQLLYQIALKSREEMHLAPTLSIGFSMTMLRMLVFRPIPSPSGPLTLPKESSDETKDDLKDTMPSNPLCPLEKEHQDSAPPISSSDVNWPSVISELKLSGLALNAIENSAFISKEGRKLTLSVSKTHQSLFTPNTVSRIETALSHYYQAPIRLILDAKDTLEPTAWEQKEKIRQQKQKKAEEALMNDPFFQQIKRDFSAEVVKNSIVLLEDEL